MSVGAGIIAIARVLRWPVLGALVAGGAIGVGRYFGHDLLAPTARDLGAEAGAGFAEGMLRFQQMTHDAAQALPMISSLSGVPQYAPQNALRGRWSVYR